VGIGLQEERKKASNKIGRLHAADGGQNIVMAKWYSVCILKCIKQCLLLEE
jgi:hypothetical protein